MRRWLRWAGLLLLVGVPGSLTAQDDTRLATLAALLQAEDRRIYEPAVFEAAWRGADLLVRRQAILGAGRIRDPRAARPLLALLDSPDTTVHAPAMFALGLLGDSTVAAGIIRRLASPAPLADGAIVEAPGTLGKLGTAEARTLFSRLLDGTSRLVPAERRRLMIPGLLVEGWRFGRFAPVQAAIPHLTDAGGDVRWRAAYLLGRTRAAVGTRAMLAATGDPHPWVRQFAARALTRIAADSARVPADSVRPALLAALRDGDPGVRVNALNSLATWRDSSVAPAVLALLADPIPNVRLEAVTTLSALPGGAAASALGRLADDATAPLVLRRQALIGTFAAAPAEGERRLRDWAAHPDPRVRGVAIELAGLHRQVRVAPLASLLEDPDPGVAASAMTTLHGRDAELDRRIGALARDRREAAHAALASAAWTVIARGAGVPEVPLLAERLVRDMTRAGGGASMTLLGALQRIFDSGPEGRAAVLGSALAGAAAPPSYLLRRRAQTWPELAGKWGPVWPAETRYGPPEYRAMAARYLVTDSTARPRVRIEIQGRGVVEVELLGDQAPLTVANFLDLVDGGFFDGGTWHRVIPNFVAQDGAGGPRATPGLAPIRDEFNPVRYDEPVLGMALSGPDTGTSQWFLTLSPQPHLDGGYTVFGRVVGGVEALRQILQGDTLLRIAR